MRLSSICFVCAIITANLRVVTGVEDSLFLTSSVTYSPTELVGRKSMSVQFSSSVSVASTLRTTYFVNLMIPAELTPVGNLANAGSCTAAYSSYGSSYVERCISSLMSGVDMIFPISSPTSISANTSSVGPIVYMVGSSLSSQFGSILIPVDSLGVGDLVKLTFCCFDIPREGVPDSSLITISLLQQISGVFQSVIPLRSVQFTPRLLSEAGWTQLSLAMDPAIPDQLSTLTFTLQPSQLILAGSTISVSLPGITHSPSTDAQVEFTATVSDCTSENLFAYYANWNGASNTLTFTLASSMSSACSVVIATLPDQFTLPSSSPANNAAFTALTMLSDGITTAIPSTSFIQSQPVFQSLVFLHSAVTLSATVNGITSITLSFSMNRNLFVGDILLLKAAGYAPAAMTASLTGSASSNIQGTLAVFDAATSVFSFNVSTEIAFDGSGQDVETLTIASITSLPMGQYANDPSLTVSVVEYNQALSSAVMTPVASSPQFGFPKSFLTSSIAFTSTTALASTDILISFIPSVTLFPGSVVTVYLRGGFVCADSSFIALYDSGSSFFVDGLASWNAATSALSMTVGVVIVGSSSTAVTVRIPAVAGFTLPEMLSENDQILLIESSGSTVIRAESVKTSPRVGTVAKSITSAILEFSNSFQPDTASALSLTFTSNIDLLPEAQVTLHLGGFTIASPLTFANSATFPWTPHSPLTLTGDFAASFDPSSVTWNPVTQDISLVVAEEITLPALSPVSITLPVSNALTLPTSLSANDASLWMTVPNMGITAPQLLTSSPRVNTQVTKGWSTSVLFYGESVSDVPYPKSLAEKVTIELVPTFSLLLGAEVVVALGGFARSGETEIVPVRVKIGEVLVQSAVSALWSVVNQTVVIPLTAATVVPAGTTVVFTFVDAFIIPPSKPANDSSLNVTIAGSQSLPVSAISQSPAIVPRAFILSSITFSPKNPLETTLVNITLRATVDIHADENIVVALSGFVREDGYGTVTVQAAVDGLPVVVNAQWLAGGSLTVALATPLAVIPQYSTLLLLVGESEGITLPTALEANSSALTVSVPGSVAAAPFLSSPLIGDGPYFNQQYCMYQYESAVRVHIPDHLAYAGYSGVDMVCQQPSPCATWVTDPCSTRELSRCGCTQLTDALALSTNPESGSFVVSGFNLQESDSLFVTPLSSVGECDPAFADLSVNILGGSPSISSDGTALEFPTVRAVKAGKFSVCLKHESVVYNIGMLTVRPKCAVPLVEYNGACYAVCPYGFYPAVGACRPIAPPTSVAGLSGAAAITIAMTYPNADSLGLSTLPSSDSTAQYFAYTFGLNLGAVLAESELSRFQITSLSAAWSTPNRVTDTVLVTAVVVPPSGSGRSTSELIQVVSALISDYNSGIYANSFFSTIDPELSTLSPTVVPWCDATASYQSLCPMSISPDTNSPIVFPSWYEPSIIIGGVIGGFVVAGMLLACYRMDTAKPSRPSSDDMTGKMGPNDFSVIKIKQSALRATGVGTFESELTDDRMKIPKSQREIHEYAKTWLEGKFVDEPFTLKRRLQ